MNPNDPSMEKTSMKGSDDDQITTENMSYAIETQKRVANPEEDGDLKRRLTASQVTMIALGGSIGKYQQTRRRLGEERQMEARLRTQAH